MDEMHLTLVQIGTMVLQMLLEFEGCAFVFEY